MARVSPARRAALRVLSEQRRRQGRVRELLRASQDMAALDARDRALASRLAFGVVACEGQLDRVLNERVRRPSSVEPRVRDALRLACFEILYLDTPGAVAVSQGTELVRSVTPRAAGMANAVLRKVAGEVRPQVDAARERCVAGGSDLDDLALVSGLPAWLLRRVRASRDNEAVRSLALAQMEPAPVYVTGNAARHDADATCELLREAGLDPSETGLPGCFELGHAAPLAASGLVDAVDVVVSDLAAQLVAHVVAPRPGAHVLEIGQGRGTKSLLLEGVALRAGGFAHVAGLDVEPYKTRLAARRMRTARLAEWVTCTAFDACALAEAEVPDVFARSFDAVFVDAPCSGTGTMRRHPEIAWSLDEESLAGEGSLPQLQARMLAAAASRVRAGGMLAYATCSVLAEENEQVVGAFLASREGAGFERVPVDEAAATAAAAELVRASMTERGDFQSLPAVGSCDGHFCAVLRRVRQ